MRILSVVLLSVLASVSEAAMKVELANAQGEFVKTLDLEGTPSCRWDKDDTLIVSYSDSGSAKLNLALPKLKRYLPTAESGALIRVSLDYPEVAFTQPNGNTWEMRKSSSYPWMNATCEASVRVEQTELRIALTCFRLSQLNVASSGLLGIRIAEPEIRCAR